MQFQSKWVELCERSFPPCRLPVVVVIRKNVKGGLCKKDLGFFFPPLLLLFFRGWLKVFLNYSWFWYLSSLNQSTVLIAAQFYFYVRRKKDFCSLDTIVV